jgi:hypothetical protein
MTNHRPVRQLEVTFMKGQPFVAYMWLVHPDRPVARTREIAPSLIVDFDAAGCPLGLEILSFDRATLASINPVLVAVGHPPIPDQELAPLRAA